MGVPVQSPNTLSAFTNLQVLSAILFHNTITLQLSHPPTHPPLFVPGAYGTSLIWDYHMYIDQACFTLSGLSLLHSLPNIEPPRRCTHNNSDQYLPCPNETWACLIGDWEELAGRFAARGHGGTEWFQPAQLLDNIARGISYHGQVTSCCVASIQCLHYLYVRARVRFVRRLMARYMLHMALWQVLGE